MNKTRRYIIVALVILGIAGVLMAKRNATSVPASVALSLAPGEGATALPRLVDLGADKCIPCKAMAPILEELKTAYAGRLQVEFIDVWKNKGAGEQYGVKAIPTQIFYAPDGRELFRHQGFFSREAILAKWSELGVNLSLSEAPKDP